MAKTGRPSAYKDTFPIDAEKLCRLGATDEELAREFGVATSTFYEWKKLYPEFSEAIKRGKTVSDYQVADRLHQRAMGFEFDEAHPVKLKEIKYENGKKVAEREYVETVMVHKVVPPDTTAAIFWLKNRRSGDWRDKHEIAHTHTHTNNMTDADLERIAASGSDGAVEAPSDPTKLN